MESDRPGFVRGYRLRWPFEVLDSPDLAAMLRDRAVAFAAATKSND